MATKSVIDTCDVSTKRSFGYEKWSKNEIVSGIVQDFFGMWVKVIGIRRFFDPIEWKWPKSRKPDWTKKIKKFLWWTPNWSKVKMVESLKLMRKLVKIQKTQNLKEKLVKIVWRKWKRSKENFGIDEKSGQNPEDSKLKGETGQNW